MTSRRRTRSALPVCFALDLRHIAAYSGIDDASDAFGIDRATLEDPEGTVPITVYYDALERAAAHSGRSHFGFHFALHWTKIARDGFGSMQFLMMSSPSLRVACERLLQYQHYWNPAECYELAPAEQQVGIRYQCWGPPRPAHVHQAERTAALIALVARSVDPQCKVLQVAFPHASQSDDAKLTRLFGVAPTYGAPWTEVILPAVVMDRPLPRANPALFELMDRYVRRQIAVQPRSDPSFTSQVFAVVQRRLHERDMSQDLVAKSIGCGIRTLARRLAEEGTTLREIVDAVRKGRAEALLESNITIAEVAFLLGYSEPAGFQHAFRRWHGMSPKAWRERGTGPAAAEAS